MDKTKTLQDSLNELQTFLELEENWDTYDGKPSTAQSVEIASKILQKIHDQNPNLKPTHVSPISSGIYLLWQIGDLDIDVEIDEESMFYYEYSNNTEIKEVYEKECFYGENIEKDIDEIVGRIIKRHTLGDINDNL